ncbi:MAG: cytochrome c [Caldilineales bacterium]
MRHPRRLLSAASISLMLLLAAGCAGNAPPVVTNAPAAQTLVAVEAPADPPPAEPTGDPQRGREIFESGGEKYTPEFYCSRCHSLDGAESYGPSMQGVAGQAAQRVPGISAEAYIRQSILEPDAFIVPGYSPNMGLIHSRLLNDQEVEDLVAFLLTQLHSNGP